MRAAAVVLVLAGCGGGSSGGGDATGGGSGAAYGVPVVPDGVEPIESFAADKLAAECATNVRCHRSATVEGCVAASLPPVAPRVAQDVQAGVINYDPHLAYRCIQLILAAPCNGGADLQSCHYAFTGTLSSGAACSLNAECASGSCAMPGCTSGCCPPGSCTAGVEARHVPVGGPCAGSGCGEGEYCDTTDGVCRARVAKGASCAHAFCQWGLVCSNTSSTCVAPAPVGGSCLGNLCDGDGTCTAAGMCAAAHEPGDTCANTATCGPFLVCANGACAPPVGFGQSCDASSRCEQGILPAGLNLTVMCVQGSCSYGQPLPEAVQCLSP
ncbi:MAG TPA: hypothetical protein VHO67_14040 [Polyangia bacterium]|nr:hypothetical protein [Polyangia bacterium]